MARKQRPRREARVVVLIAANAHTALRRRLRPRPARPRLSSANVPGSGTCSVVISGARRAAKGAIGDVTAPFPLTLFHPLLPAATTVGPRMADGPTMPEMASPPESASVTVLLTGVIRISVFAFAVVTHDALYLALYPARFWSLRADAALLAHLAHLLACLAAAWDAFCADLSACVWLLETADLAMVPACVTPGAVAAELTESVATVVADTGDAASAITANNTVTLFPMARPFLSVSSCSVGLARSMQRCSRVRVALYVRWRTLRITERNGSICLPLQMCCRHRSEVDEQPVRLPVPT
jgi:hypothetical protein